jgi:CheY-like chemotaxis protein
MKVFISSTYQDLIEYRKKAAEVVERLGQQGIRMEIFGARPDGATIVCYEEIGESDVFVGIYAYRYGYIPPNENSSITEMEYDYASKIKKPVFVFIINEDFPWPPKFIESDPAQSKLVIFKERIKKDSVIDTFTTPDELAYKVAASIGRYLFTKAIKEKLDHIPGVNSTIPDNNRNQVARRAERIKHIIAGKNILLVNDIPSQMSGVINLLEDLKISIVVSTNTEAAILKLTSDIFDLVISDMSRDGIPDAGIKLLTQMRLNGILKPTIFTVGNYEPERGVPAFCFGITNRVDELLNLIFDILERIYG